MEQSIGSQNIEEHDIIEEQQAHDVIGTSLERFNTPTSYGEPKITDIISSYYTYIASSIWSSKFGMNGKIIA